MEIRTGGLEDYELVYSLAQVVWPHTYNKMLSPEQVEYMIDMMYSREAFTEQIAVKGHRFILIKEKGKYLGFAAFEINYRYGITRIHKLYVLPEAQGKGCGQLLMSAIEAAALKNGNNRLNLNVNRRNPAVRFYQKAGFVVVGQEDISIGSGYLMEDYIMEKEI